MATKASASGPEYTQLNLQKRRLACGISLEKIADTTKISIRFLHAIEDEEFEKLPGGIFSLSYLKQYASAIGFDESKLLACYTRAVEPPRVEQPVPVSSSRGIRRWFRLLEPIGE